MPEKCKNATDKKGNFGVFITELSKAFDYIGYGLLHSFL